MRAIEKQFVIQSKHLHMLCGAIRTMMIEGLQPSLGQGEKYLSMLVVLYQFVFVIVTYLKVDKFTVLHSRKLLEIWKENFDSCLSFGFFYTRVV